MSNMAINILDRNFDPLSLGDRVRFVGPTGCSSKSASGTGEVIGSNTYGVLLVKLDQAISLFRRDGSPAGESFTLRFPCAFDNLRKCRVAQTRSGNIYEEATHECFVERLTPPPPPTSLVKVSKPYWRQ